MGKTYTTGAVTVWLRRLSVAVAVGITVIVLVRYPSLPETIPTHFGIAGKADGWGPRATILVLVAVLVGLVCGMALLSRHPWVINYPVIVTEANARSVYREGERMIVWLTVGVLFLYAGTVGAVFGWNGGVLIGLGVAGILVSLVVGMIRIASASARPRVEPERSDARPE